jgi:hypothetical protein
LLFLQTKPTGAVIAFLCLSMAITQEMGDNERSVYPVSAHQASVQGGFGVWKPSATFFFAFCC